MKVERTPRTGDARERLRFEQSVYDVLTKGGVPPPMTNAQRNALAPFEGMFIYNTSTRKLNLYTTGWETIASSGTLYPIGPQAITSTSLALATKFASPTGSGTQCTFANPCSLATAAQLAVAGDVVFLRGGVYTITSRVMFANVGTLSSPITFESYPGETAIFDGSALAAGAQGICPYVSGDWYVIRRVTVTGMPESAVRVKGNHNILDGLWVHHNRHTGIMVHDSAYATPYGSLASNNTIRNCTAEDNSDVGLTGGDYANGGNADGIAIQSGTGNLVEYCAAYRNSDDGIDVWRSTFSTVSSTIAAYNGLGDGDGNGFKMGGPSPSTNNIFDHNVAFRNTAYGFISNNSPVLSVSYNTSYLNGTFGFGNDVDTPSDYDANIASANGSGNGATTGTTNSWNFAGTVAFLDTSPSVPPSINFLRPTVADGFEDIGAVQ
jgi:hypothetical protein